MKFLAFLISSSGAVVANYKFRLHPNFAEQIFSHNLPTLLNHLDSAGPTQVYLPGSDTTLQNLDLHFNGGKVIETQLISDSDHEFTVSLRNLAISGSGQALVDGYWERVTIFAPFEEASLAMELGEQQIGGNLIPRVTVQAVQFVLATQIQVSAFGDVPLFESHEFTSEIEAWLHKYVTSHQSEFRNNFQQAEDSLLRQFDFTGSILQGEQVSENLKERIRIEDSYFAGHFLSEFDGGLDFADDLRLVRSTSFSEEPAFQRDLQIVMDENYVNNQFMQLFHHRDVFSLTEIMRATLPQGGLQGKAADLALKALMLSSVWKRWFPSLAEVGPAREVDIRCGFSKFFVEGKLEDVHATQIQFHQGNKIQFMGHLGCGVHLRRAQEQGELASMLADSLRYENHRSFFVSHVGQVTLDFSENRRRALSLMQAKIESLDLEFTEFKVYEGVSQLEVPEINLNGRVELLRHLILNTGLKDILGDLAKFVRLPVTPFFELEKCLGLSGQSSYMEIEEGIARIGYDFKVKAATRDCLFNL